MTKIKIPKCSHGKWYYPNGFTGRSRWCERCGKWEYKEANAEWPVPIIDTAHAQTPVAPSLKQRFGDWIDARTAQGIETYGGPLTTDNGRDAERDMLEELLDFCQYQEQSRLELLADNARLRARIGVARERLGLPELENYQA